MTIYHTRMLLNWAQGLPKNSTLPIDVWHRSNQQGIICEFTDDTFAQANGYSDASALVADINKSVAKPTRQA